LFPFINARRCRRSLGDDDKENDDKEDDDKEDDDKEDDDKQNG